MTSAILLGMVIGSIVSCVAGGVAISADRGYCCGDGTDHELARRRRAEAEELGIPTEDEFFDGRPSPEVLEAKEKGFHLLKKSSSSTKNGKKVSSASKKNSRK